MSTVPIRQLTAEFGVAAQLEPSALKGVAAAGFKSVINNRPDGEGGPSQPTSAVMEAAAHAAGLSYVHLPVNPALQTPEEARRFKELLASLPRPILAFCRSGTRSTKLYNAAQAL